MSELVVIEEHRDFASASRSAKELAERFAEQIVIKRCSTGWNVLASSATQSAIAEQNVKIDDIYHEALAEDFQNVSNEEHEREVAVELLEEFQSDQDDWARSEEDGWFYEN